MYTKWLDQFRKDTCFLQECIMLMKVKYTMYTVYNVSELHDDNIHNFKLTWCNKLPGGGVLNFELGTDVRPEVSTTTL